jgi:general stress protein 26
VGDWIEDVTSLIFESSFMTLATVDGDGLPWVSPVEFVCDEDLRFYWNSVIDSRHSQNVRVNPLAALSIYDSTYVAMDGQPTALYGEGSVEEFHRSELEDLLPSFERWIAGRDAGRTAPRARRGDPIDGDSPWRFYRLTPTTLYALDPGEHPEHGWPASWRVPVDLTDSFSSAYRSRLA